jgi:glycosyltransferase involved in cell wall biosynthesis
VEGVPGVVLEAAAQFVPTVAVDVGGMKEAINHGETGILLADHNPNNFAYNVIELLNDKRRLVELGENAHRLVLSNFDPGRNCLKFIALYNSLTDNKFKRKVYT